MTHEDFERAHLIDAAIMTADLMEEIYQAEMDEDLETPEVQEALDITPEREAYWIEQQDLEFA